ncbi:hypothetical protein ACFQ3Z_05320 [Streptomyces nogalater]
MTKDLEENVKEQERVTAEIAALQERLAALQHDHSILLNMQQALGIAAPPPARSYPLRAGRAAARDAPTPRSRRRRRRRPRSRRPGSRGTGRRRQGNRRPRRPPRRPHSPRSPRSRRSSSWSAGI